MGPPSPGHRDLGQTGRRAPSGAFEGGLTYGIGRPAAHSNPQFPVRTIEVEKVTSQGQHLYNVPIDIPATGHGD